MIDAIGTGISIGIVAVILGAAGLLALLFYGAYWVVRTWQE